MTLKEKAKMLPSSPGVYLMKDSTDHIIYVGKSKNLKSRVQSYFQNSKSHTKKVEKLVKQIQSFDYILTDTEFEAFMLECQLIKELKPMFNKLMKSPQAYIYILIKVDREPYRIELTNQIDENNSTLYFGPYTSKNATEKAIKGLKEFFKMDCSNPAHSKSPCLNYSLGQCMGMCFQREAMEKYRQVLYRIIALLEGTDRSILKEMDQKMKEASRDFNFEMAAKIRDYLEALKSVLKKEKVIEFTKENNYILVIEPVGDSKIKMFFIKGSKVLFRQIFEIENINSKQLRAVEMLNMLSNYKTEASNQSMRISKEEIDEAQIIYSYLEKIPRNYLVIPEEWLNSEPLTLLALQEIEAFLLDENQIL
jgi:excinuclease ABC subunit C